MDIKSWVIRTYLKLRFLKTKKQIPQERVGKLLNPIEIHKDSEEN